MDVVTQSVEIRALTGYLPGGIALYGSMTGEQVLDYLARLQGRTAYRRDDLIERLQLSQVDLRRRVRDYSRGMRQKIGLIQALQHDPELGILDEPTEGLDPLMQQAFYGILCDLRAEGRTIFFSSHVLSEVERVCDRVGIIRHGNLMAVHQVRDLLARRRRRVSIQWRGAAPDPDSLPGLIDVTVDGDRLFGTLHGGVSEIVRSVASPSLEDLTIEPASLEEAFLEYYAEDGSRPWSPRTDEPAAPRPNPGHAAHPRDHRQHRDLRVGHADPGLLHRVLRRDPRPGELRRLPPGAPELRLRVTVRLPGAVTLGTQHPIASGMLAVFAIGATSTAIAGERQDGTLEVLLARPVSRNAAYTSISVGLLVVVGVVLAALLAGFFVGAAIQGVVDELPLEHLPMLWINGFLLWGAFATFGLAASVSYDRPGPAIGLSLAYLLVNYFFEILGSLWREAEWTQEYSLFHHFQPAEILSGDLDPIDLLILGIAFVLPVVYALIVFPRRDLAAPA